MIRQYFRYILFFLLSSIALQAGAVVKNQTLYINRGVLTTVNNTQLPSLAFNSGPQFNSLNEVISISSNDMLVLKVINNDTASHTFAVKNSGLPAVILAGDSITDTLTFSVPGIFLYYDTDQEDRYLGLGGMICVSENSNRNFFWNLKEHQTSFNNRIDSGLAVDWSGYDPDYFTINGKSFPDLQNDSTARITGNVGDTIRIFVLNTGQSTHSIHFHGFHCRAVYSTLSAAQVDWVKDTWSVKSMEGYVLEMVPDKTGEYSVHDHNLVAVSGGGVHPNGMFIIMKIQ